MKKLFLIIFCGFFFFVSCDKIFLDVEGVEADLQGKWQMDQADTVFYNFQKSLFQYQAYVSENRLTGGYGYYTLHGDTAIDLELLTEFLPRSFPQDLLGWDTIYVNDDGGQDTILFRPFKIDKIDKKELILSYEGEKISFHKF